MRADVKHILGRILQDIRVEMSDAFDQNFERQAFFSEAWQRRKSPTRRDGWKSHTNLTHPGKVF